MPDVRFWKLLIPTPMINLVKSQSFKKTFKISLSNVLFSAMCDI